MFGRWNRNILRLAVPFVVMLALMVQPVFAQTSRVLEPDSSVEGVLDEDNVAQVYTLSGGVGDVVTLTVTAEAGVGVALLLTNSNGDAIAQAVGDDSPPALTNVTLPATGAYFVTVLAAPGETVPADSTFELALASVPAGSTPAPQVFAPGQILSVNGLQIALSWNRWQIWTWRCAIRSVVVSSSPAQPRPVVGNLV